MRSLRLAALAALVAPVVAPGSLAQAQTANVGRSVGDRSFSLCARMRTRSQTPACSPADSHPLSVQSGRVQTALPLTTAGPLTQILVLAPPDAFTGWPVYVTVIAGDQYGNPVPTFADTVHVTSSDPNADLPPDSTLFSGSAVFSATLKTPGIQTFTVTDTSTSLAGTSDNIFVATPPNLVVTTPTDDVGDESQCSPQTTPGTGTDTACSLRDALNYSSSFGAASITFDSNVFSASNTPAQNTITLTNGVLEIPNDTSITGPEMGTSSTPSYQVIVSGNNAGGVFQMTDPYAQGSITRIGITGGLISDPSAGAYLAGAGIYNDGTLTVSNSLIWGNTLNAPDPSSQVNGAGIYSDNDLEISNSIIAANTATSGGGAFGGGIISLSYMNATNVTVADNLVVAGEGGFAGGGGILSPGDIDLSHSTISGNQAQGPVDDSAPALGGGLASLGQTWIDYSTISGNSVSAGGSEAAGGVYVGYDLHLRNSTISANSAQFAGGLLSDGALTHISNSIVAGNSSPVFPNFYNGGRFKNDGGNLIGVDAKLAALGNYGGPAQTMLPLPGSAAICRGLPANLAIDVTTDERGLPNTNTNYPGYSAGTPCVDAGAVQTNYAMEFSQQPSTSGSTASVDAVQPITPAPALSVTESGIPVSGGAVKIADLANALRGTKTQTSVAGTATFTGISIASPQTGDTLTATLSLNAGLTLALTTISNPFDVVDVTPSMTSPTPGSVLAGSSQLFTWDRGSATAFQLKVGALNPGSGDLYQSGWINTTSANVPSIPINGVNLYVRLLYEMNGAWSSIDYLYTEGGVLQLPAMTLPAPTSTLTGASQTFTWDPGSANAFQLNIGTKGSGSGNVFTSGWIVTTSANVPSIPTNGATLYVRLLYRINGIWNHLDYTYTEQ